MMLFLGEVCTLFFWTEVTFYLSLFSLLSNWNLLNSQKYLFNHFYNSSMTRISGFPPTLSFPSPLLTSSFSSTLLFPPPPLPSLPSLPLPFPPTLSFLPLPSSFSSSLRFPYFLNFSVLKLYIFLLSLQINGIIIFSYMYIIALCSYSSGHYF